MFRGLGSPRARGRHFRSPTPLMPSTGAPRRATSSMSCESLIFLARMRSPSTYLYSPASLMPRPRPIKTHSATINTRHLTRLTRPDPEMCHLLLFADCMLIICTSCDGTGVSDGSRRLGPLIPSGIFPVLRRCLSSLNGLRGLGAWG